MLDPIRAKLKWIATATAAFAGGLAFASGLQWTSGSQATMLLQSQAAPSAQDVRPVAELNQAFTTIAETVTPAVVSITSERPQQAQRLPRSHPAIPPELRDLLPGLPDGGAPRPQIAGGSGFFVSADGFIMTNNHVVEDAEKIEVLLQDRRTLPARIVGRDPTTDVAIIKVEGSGFPTLRRGRSESTRVGEWVLAIGNPLDLGNTVTAGIVSAKGRPLGILARNDPATVQGGGSYAIEDFIQTDAAINMGNSGGPLVNLRGEAIGINTAIFSQTGFYAGYGFAVPMDLAWRVAEDLMRYGKVRRPVLGVVIEDVEPEDAEVFRLPNVSGVVVQDYSDDSPARRAGVQKGDVIVAVNGQPVNAVNELQRVVRSFQPGQTVTLDIIRYGRRVQARVELMEAPTPRVAAAPAPAREPAAEGRLGIRVAPLSAEMARQMGFREAGGVVVTEVQRFGAAGRRGLPENVRIVQLDREPVRDVADFQRKLAGKRAGQVISLTVQSPDGQERIINVRVP